MPKVNAAIDNPEAPVNVLMRDPQDNIHERNFTNFKEFEAWFNPRIHKFLGTTNNKDRTWVTLDVTTIDGPTKQLNREKPVKEKKPGVKVHHRIVYKGKEYKSLEVIWRQLNLPMSKIRKFRVQLKAAGKLAFENHEFETAH